MGEYNVSQKPLSDMSDNDVLKEAQDLRTHIAVIECELSKRQAWDRAENRKNDVWLARTRSLRSLMVSRYAWIRPAERVINRRLHA